MKTYLGKLLLAAIASLALAATSAFGDRPIAASELPTAIQTFIATHFPGANITRATVDNDGYEVDLSTGYELDFYLNGEWDSIDGDRRALPDSVIPADILAQVQARYPGASILEIDRGYQGYEVEIDRLNHDLFFPYNGVSGGTTPALGNVRLLNSTVKAGDQVIITGQNFTEPAVVKINGLNATVVSVTSREIIATIPEDVVVGGETLLTVETNGASLSAPGLSWVYSSMPVITASPVATQYMVRSGTKGVHLVTTATGSSDMVYEWQYRDAQTGQWLPATGANYINASTGTLRFVSTDLDRRVLRCAVSTRSGTTYSGMTTVIPMDDYIPEPAGLAIGAGATNYNIYVADSELDAVQVITSSGSVSTLAGRYFVSGHVDGTGTAARFDEPLGLALQSDGTLLVADSDNDALRAITPAGVVTTVGTGIDARFDDPGGLAASQTASGDTYIADTDNHLIKKMNASGVVSIVAGNARPGSGDGTLLGAQFRSPSNLAVDVTGNYIYVADTDNHAIRLINLGEGTVSTFAGQPGARGNTDGAALSAAKFNSPSDIVVDEEGNVYVADTGNSRIRLITTDTGANRVVVTLAGDVAGFRDGGGTNAWFSRPEAIALKGDVLYVADTGNGVIRSIAADQTLTVTTLPMHGGTPLPAPAFDLQTQTSGGKTNKGDSGDGGGGAPSLWLLAAMAALGGLRLRRR